MPFGKANTKLVRHVSFYHYGRYKYTSLTECATLPDGKTWADGKPQLEVMLVAYGDDSSDRTKTTVFSVAAVLGTADQWKPFKAAWQKRNGRIPFHATDCESGWGDYRGIPRDVRVRLYRDLVTLLAESDLFGFAAAISVRDFRESFPTDDTYEMPYYTCFADVLARCAGLASIIVPKAEKVELTFDRNFDRDPSTSEFYAYLGEIKHWKQLGYLGDRVTFVNYRAESGIQVADLLARETMKHMESTMLGSRERWSRASFMKLRRNPRLHFRFLDKDEFAIASITHPSKLGDDFAEGYREWRQDGGVQSDTLVNRLRFIRWRDSSKPQGEAVDRQDADSFDL